MDQMVIRPTTKFVKLGYVAVIVLIAGAAFAQPLFALDAWWLPAAAVLLLLWPAIKHWQRRFTSMTITGDNRRDRSSSRRCRMSRFANRWRSGFTASAT
jgi:hypothetical protein